MPSKIERHQLDGLVIELRTMGYSYADIVETIRERYDVHLSEMALSRYFKKRDKKLLRDYDSNDILISDIYYKNQLELKSLNSKLSAYMNEIDRKLDNSSIKPLERKHVKTDLKNMYRDVRTHIVSMTERMQSLSRALNYQSKDIRNDLIELSNILCSDCKPKVVELANKEKERRKY